METLINIANYPIPDVIRNAILIVLLMGLTLLTIDIFTQWKSQRDLKRIKEYIRRTKKEVYDHDDIPF